MGLNNKVVPHFLAAATLLGVACVPHADASAGARVKELAQQDIRAENLLIEPTILRPDCVFRSSLEAQVSLIKNDPNEYRALIGNLDDKEYEISVRGEVTGFLQGEAQRISQLPEEKKGDELAGALGQAAERYAQESLITESEAQKRYFKGEAECGQAAATSIGLGERKH